MKPIRYLAVARHLALAGLVACIATPAAAATGKLVLTGGVSSIDGAAGGGLTPWAVIGTNATDGEIGGTAHVTRVSTQDYALTSYGAALGYHNKFELSIARQNFDASPTIALNGIAPFGVKRGENIEMDVLGMKYRVFGEAVLDSLNLIPQVAVGIEHKQVQPNSLKSVLRFLDASTSGTDVYVSATKLLLEHSLLLNGTLRLTKANQNGLLGFGAGSQGKDKYSVQPEFSVAYLLHRTLAIGAEYRFKPNNLETLGRRAGLGSALREDDWGDLFVAWAPSKNFSLTGAYVDLGGIVPGITRKRDQTGWYLSAQYAF